MKNSGYFLIAMGKEYIDEACNLVKNLRKFNDINPVSVLCLDTDINYVNSTGLFDKAIPFNFDNKFSKLDKTPFEKYGGTPKILMMDYSPYDETIYSDCDMLIQSNTDSVWNHFRSIDQAVIATGGIVNKDDAMANVVANKLKKDISKLYYTHSGILYYNKNHKDFKNFCDKLKFFWENYDDYGLYVHLYKGGKADENSIFITFAELNYVSANPILFPLITHNYHKDIELPSNIVTGGEMHAVLTTLNSPPPFIHMFKKYGREHYNVLYNKLMNI